MVLPPLVAGEMGRFAGLGWLHPAIDENGEIEDDTTTVK
ncbi:MAG: hypothetical protein ACI9HK_003821 [Pirellulaceae bacterium]|jgi:hypothetical protein